MGRNYRIDLPKKEKIKSSLPALRHREIIPGDISYKHTHHLGDGAQLSVIASKEKGHHHVIWLTNLPGPLILHWGTAIHFRQEWVAPAPAFLPQGSEIVENKAAQTPFTDKGAYRKIHLIIPEKKVPLGIPFVVKQSDTKRWLNDNGRNFYVPLTVPQEYDSLLGNRVLADLADTIIDREMGNHGWTLMHRFNLCYDLLDRIGDSRQGWALIFVWLRFSAIRQLDWQRNYNTQPRELAHALDRLSQKLARSYIEIQQSREFARLTLTTVGRGGEGQRVRDEILHIMHRHHIKEMAGHFMEEWHQKLHNNTTPDDVVICEAYLDFLRYDGDLNRFYETLKQGGVSKERLKSYDRPIRSDPDFIPHLKDALLHDFGQFLNILKGVHTGTDLYAATQAAAPMMDHDLRQIVEELRTGSREGIPLVGLVEKCTEARRRLGERIEKGDRAMRELLFLDLALEDFLRVVIEQHLHVLKETKDLLPLIGPVMENLLFSHRNNELSLSFDHWKTLAVTPSLDREWALEAKALFDRTTRVLVDMIDGYHHALQQKAELLGSAFKAAPWSISLFSEEVVRGRPVFVLSALLKKIDPLLRRKAELGDWQVVSSGRATGRVKQVPTLGTVLNKTFTEPTIIITPEVSGEEELPEQIKGVITSDTVDIVSHVAIRARNAPIVFATCYDSDTVSQLESLAGTWVEIESNAQGHVVYKKGNPPKMSSEPSRNLGTKTGTVSLTRPVFTAYTLPSAAFNVENVGAKSNNLNKLTGRLPAWIAFPDSVALPFGVFEKTLSSTANQGLEKEYAALVGEIDKKPPQARAIFLEKIRQNVLALTAPGTLRQAVEDLAETASLPWPSGSKSGWESAWMCIKKVWASKWNERAYLSRRTVGIPHEDLFMAVLIQQVVEADYAFVIHTVNPVSGAKNEIFAEIVSGLGETLVGNYPGRAFSFSCDKNRAANPRIHSFPSKSFGLFGKGLIFRSDSNGEDLSQYAGAGLYDSVTIHPPRRVLLDYAQDRLVQDGAFRTELLTKIAEIGYEVEKALEVPQDIEGAYSGGKYYVVQTRPQVGLE